MDEDTLKQLAESKDNTVAAAALHIMEDYNTDERTKMAASGEALPDGSFPIRSIHDLRAALSLYPHARDPKAARKHIIARARAMGAEEELPMGWTKKATGHMASEEPDMTNAVHISEATTDLEVQGATDSDGRHIIEATLIRAGKSKNGYTYSPQALRESVHLFEGSRAFVDHNRNDALPERSVRDLVGSYRDVHFDGTRMRGALHLVPGNDWLFHLLKEAENNPNLCGLSIDAWADADPRTKQINRIAKIDSVDIVTKPAAGGQLDRVLMSEHRSPAGDTTTTTGNAATNPQEPRMEPTNAHQEPNPSPGTTPTTATATHTPSPVKESQPTNPSPDLAQLIEQMQREKDDLRRQLENVTNVLAPSAPRPVDPSSQLTQLAEEIKRDRDLSRCEMALESKLREAQLPPPVASKIRRHFEGRIFEAATLDATIAEERDTLAALTTAGQITGMGYEKSATLGMSDIDQVQAALDGLFGIYESDAAKSVPKLSGIREAFKLCTGIDVAQISGVDRPLQESLGQQLRDKVRAGRLQESEIHLREADVTTATFSYLLGTSMNKRLMMDYMAWPSEWQKFTNVVAIKDFKLQDRIRLGAFSSLSTVAEDAAYTTLSLADTHATYTATKRGNLVQITRETIINDDLYAIKQIPQKLAVAAAFTLAEFVYNLLAPNFGNIYDAHPLFDSVNHLNTGVTSGNLNTANSGAALSSAALQAAVVKMRKQTNAASKPIGLKPRFLLVPPDLEFTAMTILKSAGLPGGNNNDINPMMGYCEPIVAPQLNALTAGPASTSIWIAIADPRVIDTLEIGFVGGQANPVLLIQDLPLYGLNFTQDVISYKVRHEYGGAVVDYRGFYLGNN